MLELLGPYFLNLASRFRKFNQIFILFPAFCFHTHTKKQVDSIYFWWTLNSLWNLFTSHQKFTRWRRMCVYIKIDWCAPNNTIKFNKFWLGQSRRWTAAAAVDNFWIKNLDQSIVWNENPVWHWRHPIQYNAQQLSCVFCCRVMKKLRMK